MSTGGLPQSVYNLPLAYRLTSGASSSPWPKRGRIWPTAWKAAPLATFYPNRLRPRRAKTP